MEGVDQNMFLLNVRDGTLRVGPAYYREVIALQFLRLLSAFYGDVLVVLAAFFSMCIPCEPLTNFIHE